MTVRDEIIAALPEVRARFGSEDFTARDVILVLQGRGTKHSEGKIRAHVVNSMCAPSTDAYGHRADLESVAPGRYRACR